MMGTALTVAILRFICYNADKESVTSRLEYRWVNRFAGVPVGGLPGRVVTAS